MDSSIKVRVFISYSKSTKKHADVIKNYLVKLTNFDVFIAPDDVPIGSTDYLLKIYEKIKECSVFLSLIDEWSHRSYFADHECGIAIALEKKILPILTDESVPYGFLKNYNGILCKDEINEHKLSEIEHFILTQGSRDKDYVDLIIAALCNCTSFDDASHWAKKLRDCSVISEEQIILIKNAVENNDQVYCSYVAKPIVLGILARFATIH